MTAPTAVVTGASGYLGSQVCRTLDAQGWHVVWLARSSPPGVPHHRRYDLDSPISGEVTEVLRSADLLVHTAYDLTLTDAADIWRVNVEGTRRLLAAANDAKVPRTVVLSSMSAYAGTSQLYGRAKLDIEAICAAIDGCAVRPGLVYGDRPGGMAAALRRLTKLPVVPVIAGGAGLYTVCDTDLMAAILDLATTETFPVGTLSVAHPTRVSLRELMQSFAAEEGRRCRFMPIPWQLVYAVLRAAELAHLRLPFRADSLLGLVRTAPDVMDGGRVTGAGVPLRAFSPAPV